MCGITPTSKKGQGIYMFIMLLIPLIPIFALITQNVILLNNIIIRKAEILETDDSVERSDETAKAACDNIDTKADALYWVTLGISNNRHGAIQIFSSTQKK